MAQAPDFESIFNIEDAVEDAVKKVLKSYHVAAYTQRETDELPDERVDVQLKVGTATGHRSRIPGNINCRDAWNATLTFNVLTKRFEGEASGKRKTADGRIHGRVRARIRMACEHFTTKFTEELLPYHVLVDITPQNTEPAVNVEDDLDVSALHFAVIIGVRVGAWPAL